MTFNLVLHSSFLVLVSEIFFFRRTMYFSTCFEFRNRLKISTIQLIQGLLQGTFDEKTIEKCLN